MKTFATIALSLVIIIAGVVFLSSSICAVSSGMNSMDRFKLSDRLLFVSIALIAFGVIFGSIRLIARLNRTSSGD